jgi:hypothetical protein
MPEPQPFAERLASLRETRARLPELVRNRLASRRRRPVATHDARLLLVEVDQPARGDLAVRDDPTALADRGELLRRLVLALARPGVDGVIATTDIIDDLLLLEALESRLAIGSMNRSGIVGSTFSLDERFSGYDAETVAGSHLDGGKLSLRIDPSDPRTADRLEAVGHAVTMLAGGSLMALLEPTWEESTGDEVDLSATAQIRAIDVASALGARSSFTWLAVRPSELLADVMAATTLPTLLLGPDLASGVRHESWERALAVSGVRGMVLPASALYPADGDVGAVVDEFAELVHHGRQEGSRDER